MTPETTGLAKHRRGAELLGVVEVAIREQIGCWAGVNAGASQAAAARREDWATGDPPSATAGTPVWGTIEAV